MLAQHPGIFITEPKEPHFYSYDENFVKGADWYASLFSNAEPGALRGEGSTSYTDRTSYPKAAQRIAKSHPDAKLIYIVRNPLERIESAWRMVAVDDAGKCRPFETMLKEHRAIIDKSKYWFQINAYRDRFPDDRICVLFFEDFKSDPDATMRRCFDFLGVDPTVAVSAVRANEGGSRRVRGRLSGLMHSIGSVGKLRECVPASIRSSVRKALSRPGPGRPEWTEESKKSALNEIGPDCEQFLDFYGKPNNFWVLR